MAQNLIELVQGYFGDDMVRRASTALGESESSIGTALKGVVPVVLGSVFARAQQPGGLSDVFGLAKQAHDGGILRDLGGLLDGANATVDTTAPATTGGLLNRGAELLRSVLGPQYAPAVESVGQQAGVSSSSVISLLGMAVPVVLGLLGRHNQENNLDESGFGSYLNGQRSGLMGLLDSLPSGLGGILSGVGLGAVGSSLGSVLPDAQPAVPPSTSVLDTDRSPAVTTTTVPPPRDTVVRAEAPVVTQTTTSRWPLIVLGLIVLAALWYFLLGCDKQDVPAATAPAMVRDTVNTAPTAIPAAPTGRYDAASGNYVYEVGAPTELKLTDGTILNVGANSTEARLYSFLNNANQAVSSDKMQGWISMDRLYFATDKAALTAESQQQLENIAAILKAFPNAEIRLGGYTDNTGEADANLLLSADRANVARKALMEMGIGPNRVQAEGYGQEHPIATNDTPDGRAQNRRIDVRVTKK